jgi:DNA-binding CsgD family transcriptional regulator
MLPSSEALSKLLEALYEAPLDSSRWEEFLRLTAAAAGGEAATLLLHDSSDAQSMMSWEWGFHPEVAELYAAHFGTIDVWRSAVTAASDWVGISEQFVPSTSLMRTEFYNDLLLPYGIPHGIFAMVESGPARVANLSICRGARAGPFAEESLAIVRFLKPHIQRAYRIHSELAAANSRSAGLFCALDAFSTGVILIGPRMQVVTMNRAAERIVAAGDGLLATHDGLKAERQAESNLLVRSIQQAASTPRPKGLSVGGTVLVSRRTRPPLQVLISPVRDSTAFTLCPAQTISAIAFVVDPSQRQRPPQDILRALFGLTPAECRVALLVCDGHAPKVIAGTLGVSVETVRSQIKSIFSKTGVKRQGELIRLLQNNSGLSIHPELTFYDPGVSRYHA